MPEILGVPNKDGGNQIRRLRHSLFIVKDMIEQGRNLRFLMTTLKTGSTGSVNRTTLLLGIAGRAGNFRTWKVKARGMA